MLAIAADVWLALVGLLLGSFLGVLIDRVPRGESIVTPRSRCRRCGRLLNAVDLAPVAGYLLRRGRCGSCGARIPVAFPLLEAGSALTMLIPALTLGPARGWLVGLAVVAGGGAAIVLVASRRGSG